MPGGRHFSTPTISSTAAATDDTSMNERPSIQMSAPRPERSLRVVSGGYMNQPPSGAALKKIEPATKGTVRQEGKILQGIPTEKAKAMVKVVKDAKLKVQAAIQGEQLRVSGKSKDDLQSVIALLRGKDYPIPLQFTNYR